jgi:hypothetical protein
MILCYLNINKYGDVFTIFFEIISYRHVTPMRPMESLQERPQIGGGVGGGGHSLGGFGVRGSLAGAGNFFVFLPIFLHAL